MKSNIEKEMPAGNYWICDPATVLGDKIEEFYDDEDATWSFIDMSDDNGNQYRCFIGDMGRGPGCFIVEDSESFDAVESNAGYLGVFPEAMLRINRVLTKVKRGSKHGWGIPIMMEDDFDITPTEAAMDVGHREVLMILGV